jgi:hypothetical protein
MRVEVAQFILSELLSQRVIVTPGFNPHSPDDAVILSVFEAVLVQDSVSY